jgi:hypothetical protein
MPSHRAQIESAVNMYLFDNEAVVVTVSTKRQLALARGEEHSRTESRIGVVRWMISG